ncbi:MAG: glycerophosphodiester phosphodiesterase family protein [Pseudomonadota bacterium]
MTLPTTFLDRPIAHRALHDIAAGRPENSIEAIKAAINAGYGIEIDLQLSRDGAAMVFHDYHLGRLTHETGPFAQRTKADLQTIPLAGGATVVPTLDQVLAEVSGQVPLLIEIKDQDGAMGPNVGALERATAAALKTYKGDVAVMSFNPHAVIAFAAAAPEIPVGLVTSAFDPTDWAPLSAAVCAQLREIPDFDRTGACFVSHEVADLARPRVAEIKASGAPILCWTVKSAATEAEARKIADNVTFEGYLA